MQLIDTHTHLYLAEFDADRDEVIQRAKSIGISKLLLPNIDTDSIDPMLAMADRYKDICLPMIGLHPTSVKEDYRDQLEIIMRLASSGRFTAIGEIGIDLYWDKTYREAQLHVFRKQLSLSIETSLPAVVHSREAFNEVFTVLEEFKGSSLTGVLHAFTGNVSDARKAIDLGFKLGIGGIVTFKNSGLDKVVKEVGPENLILETDSPYLAPVPYRGKRNESSYLYIINKKLADIFARSEEEIADITYSNSVGLFKLNEK